MCSLTSVMHRVFARGVLNCLKGSMQGASMHANIMEIACSTSHSFCVSSLGCLKTCEL